MTYRTIGFYSFSVFHTMFKISSGSRIFFKKRGGEHVGTIYCLFIRYKHTYTYNNIEVYKIYNFLFFFLSFSVFALFHSILYFSKCKRGGGCKPYIPLWISFRLRFRPVQDTTQQYYGIRQRKCLLKNTKFGKLTFFKMK